METKHETERTYKTTYTDDVYQRSNGGTQDHTSVTNKLRGRISTINRPTVRPTSEKPTHPFHKPRLSLCMQRKKVPSFENSGYISTLGHEYTSKNMKKNITIKTSQLAKQTKPN